MAMSKIHLPLNPIDSINQPPAHFLYVQDVCTLVMGGAWTAAYALYIQQGRRDKSYGMPIIALCANFSWEIIYGLVYPATVTETLVLIPWIMIDIFVMITTLRYGPEEWKASPMIANNIGVILGSGCLFMLALHWAFIETYQNRDAAAFYSAFLCQALLGLSSIAQLMKRGSTRGHSLTIWLLRTIGSLAAALIFNWRYIHYPQDYAMAGTPISRLLFVTATVGDLLYFFVYMSIKNKYEGKTKAI